ncbi:MAG: DUF3854 domain-containing protein [Bryobacteraceae bacterium]
MQRDTSMTDQTAPSDGSASGVSPSGHRVAPTWGEPLAESDLAAIEASWITKEIADQAMLRRVDATEGRQIVGQKGTRDCAGILFPCYWPGEEYPHSYRIRRDNPEWMLDKEGKLKPKGKYLGAPGSGNRLYFPPGVTPEHLEEITIPIVIVEGEKKALALQRLAYHETEEPRFIPISIPGVWNWRGTVGKANGPTGERIDLRGPINDLNRIVWAGRRVLILFDSNVRSNDSVKWARQGLARELATRNVDVQFVNLPEGCGVNGVDDLLVAWGPGRVLELFEKPVPGVRLQIVLPPQFQSRPEGMFRVTSKGEQLSQVQLTNYRASVVTNILLDDGVETRLEFEIEAELIGRTLRFEIPASKFAGMDWPIEKLGSAAITFPNQRDYARAAIQSASMTAEERRIYTHTGWRKLEGRWLFFHAGGAVSGTGVVSDIRVRLLDAMSRYELRSAEGQDALAFAVRASLRLVELGPAQISFPLFAATYRAVFGQADFSLHLTGETGAFKSELAALHQQHFGATMNRQHLPGAWSSTGNSLEALAFHAKDALLVIDDFAPNGGGTDIARYHAAADRVFRAAGNHAGRGRLDSTARLREPKPPRALILSTGEDIPRGQSVRARLFILDISKGAINEDKLTECQKNASDGFYAEAMAGFVQWMAGRYDQIMVAFKQRADELRVRALGNAAHARTPQMIASLQAAFELYLEFSEECGVVNADLRRELEEQCWDALGQAAAIQGKHQAASEPAARYLTLLRACLSSGQAHLAPRIGAIPARSPEACGWRNDDGRWQPQGRCVGWTDGAHIYIESTAAYEAVQIAGRNVGEALPISEQTLRKRLHEKGLLASTDENRDTLTVRRTIGGAGKTVLHFLRGTILPDAIDESNCDQAVSD